MFGVFGACRVCGAVLGYHAAGEPFVGIILVRAAANPVAPTTKRRVLEEGGRALMPRWYEWVCGYKKAPVSL